MVSTGQQSFPQQNIVSLPQATDVDAKLYAATAREAGRQFAAAIPDSEYQRLLLQRQRFLDKQFDGSLTRSDEITLQYVHWQLDIIDDARYGGELDRLEHAVSEYEQFGAALHHLLERLAARDGPEK